MTNVSVPYVPLNNRLTSVFSDLLNVSEMGAITQRLLGNNFQLCIETDDSLDQINNIFNRHATRSIPSLIRFKYRGSNWQRVVWKVNYSVSNHIII